MSKIFHFSERESYQRDGSPEFEENRNNKEQKQLGERDIKKGTRMDQALKPQKGKTKQPEINLREWKKAKLVWSSPFL